MLLKSFAMGVTLTVFPLNAPLGQTNPKVLLIFALICALCGIHHITRRLLTGVFMASMLGLAILVFTPLIPWVERELQLPSTPPRAADAVVVLAGTAYCGTRELDGTSLARLTTGLALWRAGHATTLTVSAAPVRYAQCPTVGDLQAAHVTSLYPTSGPRTLVLHPSQSGTWFEALAVKDIAMREQWRTVLLVTSPSHLRRATVTFKRVGLDVIPIASSEPRYERALWDVGSRLTALPVLTREVAGFLKYRLLGRL